MYCIIYNIIELERIRKATQILGQDIWPSDVEMNLEPYESTQPPSKHGTFNLVSKWLNQWCRWQCGLRRRWEALWLLRSRVRIRLKAWTCASRVWCLLCR